MCVCSIRTSILSGHTFAKVDGRTRRGSGQAVAVSEDQPTLVTTEMRSIHVGSKLKDSRHRANGTH